MSCSKVIYTSKKLGKTYSSLAISLTKDCLFLHSPHTMTDKNHQTIHLNENIKIEKNVV